VNLEEIKKNAHQYFVLKSESTLLTARQNELKKRLLDSLDDAEADDKGHKVLSFEDSDLGTVKLTKQRRVTKNLDMDIAEDLLTKKGIKDTCVKMVPMLDEAAIMAAFYEGYLTEEDIDSMFPAKESFAFLIDAAK